MKLVRNGMSPRRAGIIRTLTVMAIVTLLASVLLGILSSLTGEYSTVLDESEIELIQLEDPKPGDVKATVHTTCGDMVYVLYPDECPEAVANFCSLAESGYYDNTYVYQVEPEIFFSAGAADTDGSVKDGTDTYTPRELSPKLWPLRGALCSLTAKVEGGVWKRITKTEDYYSGSRFLTVDTIAFTESLKQSLTTDADEYMKDIAEAFIEYGGIPNYSQQITIFGQLKEGFEVLDAITEAETEGEEGRQHPKEEIIITSVEISDFS
ncbi:MAG: peptidylprolyl isomerase [Oscillospiraceae bacterium]|nr:peptidylprolyl isomerase [Oscillospiraceae bacterium]